MAELYRGQPRRHLRTDRADEQLPLVARIVNDLGISLRHAHFWGMDEWVMDGVEVSPDHPLSFARADRELCFDRIDLTSRCRRRTCTFRRRPPARTSELGKGALRRDTRRPRRDQTLGVQRPAPPARIALRTHRLRPKNFVSWRRVVELHPLTLVQNARTSGGGNIPLVPTQAVTVGPKETWMADKVSIWHPATTTTPSASA